MEIGLGIHGEPGLFTSEIVKADDITDQVLNTILSGEAATFKCHGDHKHVVLMVNNLGGTTGIEICILVRRAI